MSPDEIKAKIAKMRSSVENAKKESFDTFKDQPTIRLLMSMVPAGERPEILDTLLRSAHDRGYDTAQGATLMEMVKLVSDRGPI